MALSLRELLDKQRADREARDQKPAAPLPATSVPAENRPSVSAQPEPPQAPSSPPAEPKSRGLLSRFGGSNGKAGDAVESVPGNNTTSTRTGHDVVPPQVASPSPAPVASPVLTEDETENLRKNLAFLAANLDEKEVIGQVLRTTVRQIQQHPELNAIMIDSDFDLIVAAARRSMKYTARRKEEKSDAKAKKAGQKAELDQWLKDQGIDL